MSRSVLTLIVLGGGVGTIVRYELTVGFAPATPPHFDWVTLSINVVGSFALGAVITLLASAWSSTTFVRPFVAVGVLGGFTTWSHFIIETDRLIGAGQWGTAIAYAVTSIVLGLLAAAAGATLAERLAPAPRVSEAG